MQETTSILNQFLNHKQILGYLTLKVNEITPKLIKYTIISIKIISSIAGLSIQSPIIDFRNHTV